MVDEVPVRKRTVRKRKDVDISAIVKREDGDGNEQHHEEIDARPQQTDVPFARVGMESGCTIQVSRTDWAKIRVWAEVPCGISKKAMNKAYDRVERFVAGKVEEQVEAALGADDDED